MLFVFVCLFTGSLSHFKIVVFRCNYNAFKFSLTCTGRNKVSADNVFLKSFKMIDSSSDGCLAENLGGLLEGSCGDKAVCLECGSGDTLKDEFCSSRSCRPYSNHLKSLSLQRVILAAKFAGADDVTFVIFL